MTARATYSRAASKYDRQQRFQMLPPAGTKAKASLLSKCLPPPPSGQWLGWRCWLLCAIILNIARTTQNSKLLPSNYFSCFRRSNQNFVSLGVLFSAIFTNQESALVASDSKERLRCQKATSARTRMYAGNHVKSEALLVREGAGWLRTDTCNAG